MRFQFTIRDLLLLVAILALAAGWWIDHQRINRLAVQKWEYREATSYGGIEAIAAPLGDEGWEVCNVHYGDAGAAVVLFKRPKK
jgi:hypothetical protein